MRNWKTFVKKILYVLGIIMLLLLITAIYMVQISRIPDPEITDGVILNQQRIENSKGFYTLNKNWFRKSKSGLFEMYVEGNPFEMGVINGKLSKELVIRQEDHFSEQISKMVPSSFTREYLKYFIAWFNRDLDENISEEYRNEIFGISKSASEKYRSLGSNYQRILNYHAAHDIGHALQNWALVGCTSFGTWDERSVDSVMIIGRNFDFYLGDKFAEDKIVAFFNPKKGYKFMTVTWGGFIGAVSGMNKEGLSVTINAAKSDYPLGSATPVSLVAREILQYAKNIGEAITIAKNRNMFVSESLLVASAADNKAVIIEKTPDTIDVFDPNNKFIVCTNHFQSKGLAATKKNLEQINESASAYRYKRLLELLNTNGKNTVEKTINILRDRKGLNNAEIGEGNEKAINQLIAHHSIVFEPQKGIVWISTSPWQLGQYVAYDLNKIFSLDGLKQDVEISEASLAIPPDTFLLTSEYRNFEIFKNFKQRILNNEIINTDSLVASNPEYYHTYILAGDYSYKRKDFNNAFQYYKLALTKVIATLKEEEYIKSQIEKVNEKLRQ